MLLRGRLADIMAMMNKNLYSKFLFINSMWGSMLYVKMKKALYGLLGIVLFFYKLILKDSEEEEFILEPV